MSKYLLLCSRVELYSGGLWITQTGRSIFRNHERDVENELLYLAGTGKRVAVSASGPLGNIPSMDDAPDNSISVIETNVLNKLGLELRSTAKMLAKS